MSGKRSCDAGRHVVFSGGLALSEERLGTNQGNPGEPDGFTEKADAFSAQPSLQIDSVINLHPQDFPDLYQVFLITR